MGKAIRGARKGKSTKKTLPSEDQIFKECLRSVQELLKEMAADEDLVLAKDESEVVAKITESFELQTEMAGHGKPVPLSGGIGELRIPLLRAALSRSDFDSCLLTMANLGLATLQKPEDALAVSDAEKPVPMRPMAGSTIESSFTMFRHSYPPSKRDAHNYRESPKHRATPCCKTL